MTSEQKEKWVQLWAQEGMPEEIARCQIARVERGWHSDLAFYNRAIYVRMRLETSQAWLLFDAVEEARTWENLGEQWRQLIENVEARAKEGNCEIR